MTEVEQQIREREQHSQEQQNREERESLQPERERLSGPSQVARAVLEGVPLLEMPPLRLEELAALVGNGEMAALLERQMLPLEETRFSLPKAVETEPFPVPDAVALLTQPPTGLPEGEPGGRAFDPARLSC